NAKVLLSHLPAHIAQRELAVIGEMLRIPSQHLTYHRDDSALDPGNCVTVILKSEGITEVFTALGKRGLPAEAVARQVVEEVRQYLKSGVPVGRFLADQLLVPLALTGKGAFVTSSPSLHTTTNMTVISQFTQRPFSQVHLTPTTCRIELT
ncbi:MAG: hypothetical protein HKM94_05735, partial [Halobacteria archaeon]|nr:hypothetical protein [Halobacteria archaeon]